MINPIEELQKLILEQTKLIRVCPVCKKKYVNWIEKAAIDEEGECLGCSKNRYRDLT